MGQCCSSPSSQVDQPAKGPDPAQAPSTSTAPPPRDFYQLATSPDEVDRQKGLAEIAASLEHNKRLGVEYAEKGLYSQLAESINSKEKRECLPAVKCAWQLAQNVDTHAHVGSSPIVPALITKLTSQSNSQRTCAAQSLLGLARTPALREQMSRDGQLYDIILPGLREAKTEPVQTSFSTLLSDAARYPGAPKHFATKAHLAALLDMTLAEEVTNPRVKEATAESLQLLLAGNVGGLQVVGEEQRVGMLFDMVAIPLPFVQAQGLKILQMLALQEKQQWLLDKGVLPLLRSLLPTSEEQVERATGPDQIVWSETCQTLCELCAGQQAIKRAIVGEAVVPPMLYCLRSGHGEVRASVCRALYSVLVVDEAKDEVYSNGGIPLVLEVMGNPEAEQEEVENATTALRNLCFNHRPAAKAVVALGGVRPLVQVLERGDESEAQKQALAATINLLATLAAPEDREGEQDVYLDLCESGGVQALTSLIHMGVSGEVKEGKQWMGWAAQALSYIVGHPQCERYVLKALRQQAIEEAEAESGNVLDKVKDTLDQLAEEADPSFL